MKRTLYLLTVLACLSASLLSSNALQAEAKTRQLANGLGLYDFGDVLDKKTAIFTIENQGDSILKLTGTPAVQLSNTRDFEVIEQPSVEMLKPGQITNFKVTFYANMKGMKSTKVIIPTNDRDKCNYSFVATAKGVSPNPSVEVSVSNTKIAKGSRYYIGEVEEEGVTTFSIKNIGGEILKLTDAPSVDMEDYRFKVVRKPVQKRLRPGESTSFDVKFYVLNRGYQSANVHIPSNDPVNPDYNFIMSATGIFEKPDVNIVAIARDWQRS